MTHRDLSDHELAALAYVDDRELVRDLLDLLVVPSISGSDAESDIQHRVAKQLVALDLDVDLWSLDLPALTSDPDFPGWEVPRTEAWGLVATTGTTDPALVLQAHVDVVPPGDPAT
jgi:acetylornithine deacetylase